MSEVFTVLHLVIPPILVAGAIVLVALLAAQAIPGAARRGVAPLALAAAFAAGFAYARGWPDFPAKSAQNWLPYAIVGAGLFGALAERGPASARIWALRAAFVVGALVLMGRFYERIPSSPLYATPWIGLLFAGGIAGTIFAWSSTLRQRADPLPWLLICLVCGATSLSLALSRSNAFGTYAGMLSMAAVLFAAMQAIRRAPPLEAAAFTAACAWGLTMYGGLQSTEVPTGTLLALFAASWAVSLARLETVAPASRALLALLAVCALGGLALAATLAEHGVPKV